MNHDIFCANPHKQYLAQSAEIDLAIRRVLNSSTFILGSEVSNFESEFASYLGAAHCIGVNSGTDALTLSLRALGIGVGDEVITPSHTAVATVAAIVNCGATPVFVDIEAQTFTIDPARIVDAITPRTKAIIAVHLYGHPCDMDAMMEIIKNYGLHLVEDCAQAHGAEWRGKKVGTFGVVGCFSFYPTKNLGAIGDGGAVVTNDSSLAQLLQSLRQYGWDSHRQSQVRSGVSRLDELQAAILRAKLPILDRGNSRRGEIAKIYEENLALAGIILPMTWPFAKHVFHLFVVQVSNRDETIRELNRLGIFPGIHYPIPVHLQPAYRALASADRDLLPATELISRKILSLPMYSELEDSEIQRVYEGMSHV